MNNPNPQTQGTIWSKNNHRASNPSDTKSFIDSEFL